MVVPMTDLSWITFAKGLWSKLENPDDINRDLISDTGRTNEDNH